MLFLAICAAIAGVAGFILLVGGLANAFAAGMASSPEPPSAWPFSAGCGLIATSAGLHAVTGTWPWFAWPWGVFLILLVLFLAYVGLAEGWSGWAWAVIGGTAVAAVAIMAPMFMGG